MSKRRLIKIKEVIARTSLSQSDIYRRMNDGNFPKPVVISQGKGGAAHRVAWVESEVDEWIDQLIAENRADTVKSKIALVA